MDDSRRAQTRLKPSRALLLVCAIVVSMAAVMGVLLYPPKRPHQSQAAITTNNTAVLQTHIVSSNNARSIGETPLPLQTVDFSTSNVVSTLLGKEGFDDGVVHLANERDGRTSVEDLDGVTCRYLNRRFEDRTHGYLYFALHPDFKCDELKAAWIEIEYFLPSPAFLRLQYDAMEGNVHRQYKGVMAREGEMATLGASARFTRVSGSNAWQIATFHIKDGAFMNSQNGGADFRLEVIPPEIYVRRVTVTREPIQPSRTH
jgi:hypothetical protein